MLQTCTQCGAINDAHAQMCCFCDARLARKEEPRTALGESSRHGRSLASSEPGWRREVAHRLEAYRARRRGLQPNDSQAALPFTNGNGSAAREPAPEHRSSLTPAHAPEPDTFDFAQGQLASSPDSAAEESPVVERMEIAITQPDLKFADIEEHPRGSWHRPEAGNQSPVLPVAALGERQRAGLLDAAFLLLAYAGFLALFTSLGGHFSFDKFGAAVYAAALVLFYAQYFTLFTVLGGATPGMRLCGLCVVSFDGGAPTPRQLCWRSFGYLVSGGTLLLGFLWALWDEDVLTWQDRISQTYLTYAERLGESNSLGAPGNSADFARK